VSARTVLVPADRVVRWFDNFASRHGAVALTVADGRLVGTAADGSRAVAALPFAREYDGPPDAVPFTGALVVPRRWGVLLVRKGGFAVASLHGVDVHASKVGQRHVQGRTKAGGQSQQRFARRRDNQARQAYEAAADHAHRILAAERLEALVCGGDHQAVEQVLADRRLTRLVEVRTGPWLPVPDPRRAVLEQAVADAVSVSVELTEPGGGAPAEMPAE
jgi:hypothetical protein